MGDLNTADLYIDTYVYKGHVKRGNVFKVKL